MEWVVKICKEMMNMEEEQEKDSTNADMFVEEEYGEKLAEYMEIKEEKVDEEEKPVELEELLNENIKHETKNTEDILSINLEIKIEPKVKSNDFSTVDNKKLVRPLSRPGPAPQPPNHD